MPGMRMGYRKKWTGRREEAVLVPHARTMAIELVQLAWRGVDSWRMGNEVLIVCVSRERGEEQGEGNGSSCYVGG